MCDHIQKELNEKLADAKFLPHLHALSMNNTSSNNNNTIIKLYKRVTISTKCKGYERFNFDKYKNIDLFAVSCYPDQIATIVPKMNADILSLEFISSMKVAAQLGEAQRQGIYVELNYANALNSIFIIMWYNILDTNALTNMLRLFRSLIRINKGKQVVLCNGSPDLVNGRAPYDVANM